MTVGRTRRRYKQEVANRWIMPVRKGYRMMCCDCGLVHVLDFRVRARRAWFRVFRDNRATATARVWRKRRGE